VAAYPEKPTINCSCSKIYYFTQYYL
jgi:hypothetical protein